MYNIPTKIMKNKETVSDRKQNARPAYLWPFEEIARLAADVRLIGEQAKRFWREGVSWEEKGGHHDIVSEADKRIEDALIRLIKNKYPKEKILSEESGGDSLGDTFWVIDPIDGTTVFSRGGRDWCMVISRVEGGNFDFSMIYVPLGTEGAELYYAKRGYGAYIDEMWNGERRCRKLCVTKTDRLGHATLATNQEEFWSSDHEVIDLSKQCRGINIPGSTTYMLISVAAGRFDIAVDRLKYTWDLPGLLLVEEAGGMVTKIDGMENFDFVSKGKDCRNDFLATNGLLHDKALRAMKRL
jgi:myo-inositol-1(or 4)-monophosphatase